MRTKGTRDKRKSSLGEKLNGVIEKFFMFVMSIAFMAVGGIGLTHHARNVLSVRSWVDTTAKVISSSVESHRVRGRHGSSTSYSPKVVYAYAIDGVMYEGDQYSNLKVGTNDYKAHQRKANSYRKGDVITIYYNPDNPSESVVIRKKFIPLHILGFHGIFLIVGFLLLVFTVKSCFSEKLPVREKHFFNTTLKRTWPGELNGLALFTGLWNFVVWIILSLFFSTGTRIFSLIGCLLMVFPVIGVGFLFSLMRNLIAYYKVPHYELTITCATFRVGETAQVNYAIRGDADMVRKIKVEIVSVNCDLRDGKTLSEDPKGGVVKEICEINDPARFASGSFAFTIPAMPPAKRRSWSLRLITFGPRNRRAKVEYTLV